MILIIVNALIVGCYHEVIVLAELLQGICDKGHLVVWNLHGKLKVACCLIGLLCVGDVSCIRSNVVGIVIIVNVFDVAFIFIYDFLQAIIIVQHILT